MKSCFPFNVLLFGEVEDWYTSSMHIVNTILVSSKGMQSSIILHTFCNIAHTCLVGGMATFCMIHHISWYIQCELPLLFVSNQYAA